MAEFYFLTSFTIIFSIFHKGYEYSENNERKNESSIHTIIELINLPMSIFMAFYHINYVLYFSFLSTFPILFLTSYIWKKGIATSCWMAWSSLCMPSCLWIPVRIFAPVSCVLGLKMCAITHSCIIIFSTLNFQKMSFPGLIVKAQVFLDH